MKKNPIATLQMSSGNTIKIDKSPRKVNEDIAYGREELLEGAVFEHFKGNQYKMLHIGKHSETQEEMVVYQKLEDASEIWIRPIEMFLETVLVEGKVIRRFRKLL